VPFVAQDKEVLILGGGDGGLLKELLDLAEPPAFVTMVDIDETVMDACSELMPSVCGKYLAKGNREGQRHKVVTGCALEFIKNALVRF
jgi:spermidine synthase